MAQGSCGAGTRVSAREREPPERDEGGAFAKRNKERAAAGRKCVVRGAVQAGGWGVAVGASRSNATARRRFAVASDCCTDAAKVGIVRGEL